MAKRERDMATTDVVGAYFLADFSDYVIMRLQGKSAAIMCKTDSKYKKFSTHERRENGVISIYLCTIHSYIQDLVQVYLSNMIPWKTPFNENPK